MTNSGMCLIALSVFNFGLLLGCLVVVGTVLRLGGSCCVTTLDCLNDCGHRPVGLVPVVV